MEPDVPSTETVGLRRPPAPPSWRARSRYCATTCASRLPTSAACTASARSPPDARRARAAADPCSPCCASCTARPGTSKADPARQRPVERAGLRRLLEGSAGGAPRASSPARARAGAPRWRISAWSSPTRRPIPRLPNSARWPGPRASAPCTAPADPRQQRPGARRAVGLLRRSLPRPASARSASADLCTALRAAFIERSHAESDAAASEQRLRASRWIPRRSRSACWCRCATLRGSSSTSAWST